MSVFEIVGMSKEDQIAWQAALGLQLTYANDIVTFKGTTLFDFYPTSPFTVGLDFGNVDTVVGDFGPTMVALTSIDVGPLNTVTGHILLNSPSLPALNLSSLTRVGGYLDISVDAVTSLDMSVLATVGGSRLKISSTALTVLDLSSLASCPAIEIDADALTSLTLNGGLLSLGGFTMTGALNEATVDSLLVLFASMDGTNGTTSMDNTYIQVTGTSAPPSATGLAAKVTLEGRGNTVVVNS